MLDMDLKKMVEESIFVRSVEDREILFDTWARRLHLCSQRGESVEGILQEMRKRNAVPLNGKWYLVFVRAE